LIDILCDATSLLTSLTLKSKEGKEEQDALVMNVSAISISISSCALMSTHHLIMTMHARLLCYNYFTYFYCRSGARQKDSVRGKWRRGRQRVHRGGQRPYKSLAAGVTLQCREWRQWRRCVPLALSTLSPNIILLLLLYCSSI
jgi:hypothetical protein